MDEETLREAALDYHRAPTPGQDLGRRHQGPDQPARSVARLFARRRLCLHGHPRRPAARRPTLTSRANLVAVITNGTAVLGLGNIGPLAGKPVMEGKGCLFKKFAGIDVFDIEIDATDPDRIVDIVAALEPTFGGINLEDIKAPECFIVERKLRERMKIPVFHDDQHGTAIIVAAAVLNGLKLVGKDIASVKVAVSGAGAAALACLDLLVKLGLQARQHLRLRHQGRRLQRPHRGDGPGEGALRPGHQRAHAGRDHARRRHLPRPVGRRRAEAGDGRRPWRATR